MKTVNCNRSKSINLFSVSEANPETIQQGKDAAKGCFRGCGYFVLAIVGVVLVMVVIFKIVDLFEDPLDRELRLAELDLQRAEREMNKGMVDYANAINSEAAYMYKRGTLRDRFEKAKLHHLGVKLKVMKRDNQKSRERLDEMNRELETRKNALKDREPQTESTEMDIP